MVKSRVIKKEKAEVKYTDSISSGNAAIFISEHDGKIIINMGNIPSKEEVIFISEFIHFTKKSAGGDSDLYEFEIMKNLPIFKGKDKIFYKNKIKGKINIKTRNKILNIRKGFNYFVSCYKIIEEKYLNEDKNEYLILYENYKNFNSNKKSDETTILFDTNYTEPLAFLQKSSKLKEENYLIQCKIKDLIDKKEKEIFPELYIFLIDQSYSMYDGDKFEIIKEALELFLQSLPVNSYYQFVGYGTKYIKYDDKPKEYNQENINESLKLIKNLKAELGGNNIYDALFDVGCATYENLNFRKNIFLLTGGKIESRRKVSDFINNNNSLFRIFLIGIGDNIDERLIKRIGSIGRVVMIFAKNMKI